MIGFVPSLLFRRGSWPAKLSTALLQQSRPVTSKAAERQNTFVIGATFRRDESADELSLVKDSVVKMIVHFDNHKREKVQHTGRTDPSIADKETVDIYDAASKYIRDWSTHQLKQWRQQSASNSSSPSS